MPAPPMPGYGAPPVSPPPGITMPPGQGGAPPLDPSLPGSGSNGGYNFGDYNDPYNSYLAAVPIMEQQMHKQLGGAMADAGFSGNRWSSSAQNAAGQIGAETSMRMNQMLNQTMFEQANRDQDRALSTAGQYMNLGGLEEQAQQGRLRDLMGYGQWEQGRQDNFAGIRMNNWNQDRLGYLPYLLQFGSAQGTPSGGTPYQTVTSPGSQPQIPPELLAAILGKLF